jgi:EmrB/QacA subfamily drug resistance transporter
MSASMPTIVADLGGMPLYAWAYTSYMLSRAVSLPIFGKLADRFNTKRLFMVAIALFIFFSALAGFSRSMAFLIVTRTFQGIGAGGNFALVYIVLAEIAPSGKRGQYLSWASFVWGLASILGPTLGGLIINYLSWPWIFFINIPVGLIAACGILVFYMESRQKAVTRHIDFLGALTLTVAVVSLLLVFMLGGQDYAWLSPQLLSLVGLSLLFTGFFIWIEKQTHDPVLPLTFFAHPGFRNGNTAVFFSAFAVFALFAYAPLFVQGVLGRSPMHVGLAMLVLSSGWSLGAFLVGRFVHRIGRKRSALIGAGLLVISSIGCLLLSYDSNLLTALIWFMSAGLGMGFNGIATLLKVQNAVSNADLGVATSSNQFARSLGGTVGVGICGGILATRLSADMGRLYESNALAPLTAEQTARLQTNIETVFDPQVIGRLPLSVQEALHQAVSQGLTWSFAIVVGATILCLIACILLPRDTERQAQI